MKKSIILAIILLTQSIITFCATTGQITNNSNISINVVYYTNYVAPTTTRSAQGRYGSQGTVISAGQNFNFPDPGIRSVDVFYGNGTLPPLHVTVTTNSSYTINPGAQWTVTQD